MNELNPDHPVTRGVHDHWHKIVALLMHKLGMTTAVITPADMEAFSRSEFAAVTISDKRDVITLQLVNRTDAERLAKQEGGLPS